MEKFDQLDRDGEKGIRNRERKMRSKSSGLESKG